MLIEVSSTPGAAAHRFGSVAREAGDLSRDLIWGRMLAQTVTGTPTMSTAWRRGGAFPAAFPVADAADDLFITNDRGWAPAI